jgi:hypothetical protein
VERSPSAFDQFNPSLGTLTDVNISLSLPCLDVTCPFGSGATWTSAGNLVFSLSLNGTDAGSTTVFPGTHNGGFGFFGLPDNSFFEGTGTISFGMSATGLGTLVADGIDANIRYTFTPAPPRCGHVPPVNRLDPDLSFHASVPGPCVANLRSLAVSMRFSPVFTSFHEFVGYC